MRVWSRMALAMAAGAWIFPASLCLAEDDKPATAPAPKAEKPADAPTRSGAKAENADAPAKGRSVELELRIGGLGEQGCDVEVKPGNASCHFKKQTQHVASEGKLTLVIKEVELRGVDRNCTFAIILREKGQSPKTVYRGFRMAAATDATSERTESFTCFMSSPSKVAGLEREGRIIR
jgi:hypothetical protein